MGKSWGEGGRDVICHTIRIFRRATAQRPPLHMSTSFASERWGPGTGQAGWMRVRALLMSFNGVCVFEEEEGEDGGRGRRKRER